ncbi:hypothetical protein F3F96_02455 [Mariprofundus sp. NF]|uniref:hypothetical protein n=1 Tax=Mariprofundus sp. NF TaxID=2608716 RepID=UPI0015A39EA9|nr:hypothetical protein [Mariprofundus sp. NF]NWF38001.1 hypothetical protein [Mariprofundus sp. NF]
MAFIKSLYEAFSAPIHFKLTQSNGKRTLSFRLYPIVLLLAAALLFIIISVGIITTLALDKQLLVSQQYQISELQHQQSLLSQQNSKVEAQLSLRDAQIDAMKQQQKQIEHEKLAMQKRLDMFNDVLAARKNKGLHMLKPTAYWKQSDQISYSLILVKGQNFPRWQKGELSFSVLNPEGEELPLRSPKGREKYKFDMTTQQFVSGSLVWTESWQPENLIITIADLTNRNTNQFTIPILSHAMLQPARE